MFYNYLDVTYIILGFVLTYEDGWLKHSSIFCDLTSRWLGILLNPLRTKHTELLQFAYSAVNSKLFT